MKIAIDVRTATGEKAGKGWYTFHIVRNLLKLDTKNDYILYTKAGISAFEGFPNATQKIIGGPNFLWHLRVIRDLKKEKVKLFFAPSSYIIPAFLPKSIKSIVAIHDLVAILFPKNHNKKAVILEKLLIRRVLKKAKHIITVSDNTKKDLHNKFKINPKKMTTIYCSASENFKIIPKEDLKEFVESTNLPKKFLLAVGTIIPRKNYTNLIKSFAQVSKKFPEFHLLIVGKKGWQYEEIFDLVHTLYLEKKVHFLSYLSEESLLNLYNLATALIFPSIYEGFGIPALEAMKCGCPVITSQTSSIPEVVNDAAILIDPTKPQELAQAITRVIKSPQLQEQLRQKGLSQSQKFSWKKSAEKLLELINHS